jgi:hypothetical protein
MVIPVPFDIFDSDAGALVTTDIEWAMTEEPTVTPAVSGVSQTQASGGSGSQL